AETAQHALLAAVELASDARKGIGCHDHLPIGIELQLVDRIIADTYRPRMPEAGKVRKLALAQLRAAVNVVEDIQPRPGEACRVQKPVEISFRFGVKSKADEGAHRQP